MCYTCWRTNSARPGPRKQANICAGSEDRAPQVLLPLQGQLSFAGLEFAKTFLLSQLLLFRFCQEAATEGDCKACRAGSTSPVFPSLTELRWPSVPHSKQTNPDLGSSAHLHTQFPHMSRTSLFCPLIHSRPDVPA